MVTCHIQVTVQELIGSLTPQTPPDPNSVVHFKGIDNAADGNGELTDIVPGLPPGFYRVCTMASASNHQPVIMPVAKYVGPSLRDYLLDSLTAMQAWSPG